MSPFFVSSFNIIRIIINTNGNLRFVSSHFDFGLLVTQSARLRLSDRLLNVLQFYSPYSWYVTFYGNTRLLSLRYSEFNWVDQQHHLSRSSFPDEVPNLFATHRMVGLRIQMFLHLARTDRKTFDSLPPLCRVNWSNTIVQSVFSSWRSFHPNQHVAFQNLNSFGSDYLRSQRIALHLFPISIQKRTNLCLPCFDPLIGWNIFPFD